MTNTLTITVAMIAAALLAFAAVPLQVLAQVSAGGTVGTEQEKSDFAEPPNVSVPETDLPATATPELPDIPELSDLPKPDLPATATPELPDIPELSDLPKPELPVVAEPDLPDIPEPEIPAIPELSDLPKPEL
jgi:hypothetical protein